MHAPAGKLSTAGDSLLRGLAKVLILLYRTLLSPVLGNHCRFTPSCSRYALEAFDKHPFFPAAGLVLKRLAKCHPYHPGGYDPV